MYVVDHGCFGDQLWAHESVAQAGAAKLGIALSTADRDTCLGETQVLLAQAEYGRHPNAPREGELLHW